MTASDRTPPPAADHPSPASTKTAIRATSRWHAYARRHPSWWLLAIAGAAWWALVLVYVHPLVHHGHGDPMHLHLGFALAWWTTMVTAMMLPWLAPDARWLAFRSLPRLRHRSIAVFAGAFLLVWTVFGAAALVAMAPVNGVSAAAAMALVVAAAWQVAPARRRMLRRCGALRVPAIRGARAGLDWARSGAVAGGRCVAICWALMVPMAIVHSPVLMVGTALMIAGERRAGANPERRAGRPVQALALLGLGMGFAVLA